MVVGRNANIIRRQFIYTLAIDFVSFLCRLAVFSILSPTKPLAANIDSPANSSAITMARDHLN